MTAVDAMPTQAVGNTFGNRHHHQGCGGVRHPQTQKGSNGHQGTQNSTRSSTNVVQSQGGDSLVQAPSLQSQRENESSKKQHQQSARVVADDL